jgi:hypothetical protein
LTGCLFNIFLYFNIDNETKERLNEPRKYFKAFLDGNYTIKFVPTDDDLLEQIKGVIQEETMVKYHEQFNDEDDEEKQDELMEKIINETNEKMKEYEKFIEEVPFDGENAKFPSQKVVLDKLNSMCDSQTFKKMLSYGLSIRENQRIQEKCPDISYEKPTNIINLKEIKENPKKLDEIMKARNL